MDGKTFEDMTYAEITERYRKRFPGNFTLTRQGMIDALSAPPSQQEAFVDARTPKPGEPPFHPNEIDIDRQM